jgi:hypothetical protein
MDFPLSDEELGIAGIPCEYCGRPLLRGEVEYCRECLLVGYPLTETPLEEYDSLYEEGGEG